MRPPVGVDRCRSVLVYEGAGRELVARLKYRNARSSLAWLASAMAALVAPGVGAGGIDVVTWAPTSADRRRRRGFDQAELLARAVARQLGIPCRPLLERGPGPPQTGRGRAERCAGPIYVAHRRVPHELAAAGTDQGWSVLLVDDLVTTGATLSAAASALRTLGATTVMAVTAGRTPLKVRAPPADP
jgi:predicted amidophosphoribosyltransferase